MRVTAWGAVVAVAVIVGACASTKPTEARRSMADLVAERTGVRAAVTPKQDAESRAQVRRRVAELLGKPLTLDRALQVAVLNNRQLHAQLEELGVAQADLVQAGLLENPVIAGDVIISTQGHGIGGGVSLSQSLLSVFLIPAKRRLAKARLQHAIVVASNGVMELVRDVKIAYVHVQAAAAVRDLYRTLAQGAEVADELAQRQQEAGNLPDLDRERFAAALDQARLALLERDLALAEAREQLNRLLGLWGARLAWRPVPLPEVPPAESELDGLERRAVRDRLDVSAARFGVEAIERAIELRRRGFVPQIDGGVEAGNEVGDDIGHEWVIGPSLAIELPIFDPGHADFARLNAHLRQAQHRLQHLAIVARSETRLHRAQLVAARRKVDYIRKTVLPRRATIGARSIERYNAMLIGTYELLETRAQQVEARREYVDALRDYWTARAELEYAVGGGLGSSGS